MTIRDIVDGASESQDSKGLDDGVDWAESCEPLKDLAGPTGIRDEATTVTAARGAVTTTAAFAAALESRQIFGDEETDNSCPLLQGVSIDRLPLRFQRLLSMDSPPPTTTTTGSLPTSSEQRVDFYPGHIPMPPCICLFFAFPFCLGLAGMATSFSTLHGGTWVEAVMVLLFLAPVVWSGIAAIRIRRERAPLFAILDDGSRKPWPGDWKLGTYLVGNSALMEYDGTKAWLIPVESIVHIEHEKPPRRNSSYQTVVFFRSPSLNASEHPESITLRGLDEPHRGREIKSWHERCNCLEQLEQGNESPS